MNITQDGENMARMRHESRIKMGEKIIENKKKYNRKKLNDEGLGG